MSVHAIQCGSQSYCRGQRHLVQTDMITRKAIERVASKVLARDGRAAIWVLHLAAARAYREGNKAAAVAIIEIADADEREWVRRGEMCGLSEWPDRAGWL